MRVLRHDNHLLWLSVMAVIGLTMYFAFSYGNRTTHRSSPEERVTNVDDDTQTEMIRETVRETARESANDDTDDNTSFQEQIESAKSRQQQLKGKQRRVTFDSDVQEAVVENKVYTEPTYVFLDLAKQDFLKDPFTGRVVLQLRPDVAPRTSANFVKLCEDKKYVNTPFHRVIKDFMLQGGDIVHQDGTGSYSIYGGEGSTFDDEPFMLKHDQAGVLSMANSGPNTNGSQFFITTTATPHLDGKHVVFGKVVQGIEFIHDIEREMTDSNNTPIRKCYIMNCGLLDASELSTGTTPSNITTQQHTTTQHTALNPMTSFMGQQQPFDQSVVPPIEPSPFSL